MRSVTARGSVGAGPRPPPGSVRTPAGPEALQRPAAGSRIASPGGPTRRSRPLPPWSRTADALPLPRAVPSSRAGCAGRDAAGGRAGAAGRAEGIGLQPGPGSTPQCQSPAWRAPVERSGLVGVSDAVFHALRNCPRARRTRGDVAAHGGRTDALPGARTGSRRPAGVSSGGRPAGRFPWDARKAGHFLPEGWEVSARGAAQPHCGAAESPGGVRPPGTPQLSRGTAGPQGRRDAAP